MGTLSHERVRDGLVDLPPQDTGAWASGRPWPSNLQMLLANNASHLVLESLRHPVHDDLVQTYDLGDKTSTWADLDDVQPPSDADIAAATPVYKRVSWAPQWTRKYGPWFAICDRKTADGRACMRRLKGVVRVASATLDVSYPILVVIVLTTHSSPTQINAGNVLAFDSFTHAAGTVLTATDIEFDFAVDQTDRQLEGFAGRKAAAGGGPVQTFGTPLYLWVCLASRDGVQVSQIDAWEAL